MYHDADPYRNDQGKELSDIAHNEGLGPYRLANHAPSSLDRA